MRRYGIGLLFLISILFVFNGTSAEAYSLQWINESRDYSVGEVLGGWQVLEYKDAVADNANGVWTTTGLWQGSNAVLGSNGLFNNSVMWCYEQGPTASATFTTSSTALAFMLQSDSNDGEATFMVDLDGVLSNYDMRTLPYQVPGSDLMLGTLVVYDLAPGQHTVKIIAVDQNNEDVHFYGAAALTAVPEPLSMLLLGLGLAGVAGARKIRM